MLFWRLGARALADWDEAIYAQVAREVLEDGHWLTLHWTYEPWFEKPPLLPWLTALLYGLFGVSEFWARAVSAASGVGVAVLTFVIARRAIPGRLAAYLSVAVLLGHEHFVRYARFGTTDVLLTLAVYLAILGYLWVVQDERDTGWWLVWLGFAVGFMTKSVAVGIVLPVLAAAAFVDGELRRALRSRVFWLGLALAVVCIAPWHLYVFSTHGADAFEIYAGKHLVTRAATALEGNTGPPSYYVERLASSFWPWSYFAIVAVAHALAAALDRRRALRVLLFLVITVLALYSAVATKLPWYVTPVFPALSILVGGLVADAWNRRGSYAYGAVVIASLVSALYVSAGCAIALAVAVYGLRFVHDSWERTARRVMIVALLVPLPFLSVAALGEFYVRTEDPLKSLALAVARRSDEDRTPLIVMAPLEAPAAVFYSRRPVLEADTFPALVELTRADSYRPMILHRWRLRGLVRYFDYRIERESGDLVQLRIRRRQ
jgi:4-amino-4-deoxy-L-arabinose transferase-like glycosyltransferase